MKITRPFAELRLPDAARAAVRQAFGRREPDAVEALGGGLSGGPAFRLEVSGRDYLLKLERPPDGFNDPARQYACLQAASSAGLAPALRFADADRGVSISDFVRARPLGEHPGGRRGLLQALGDLVRRLQALPTFPPLIDFPDGVGLLLGRAAAVGGLSARESMEAAAVLEELTARLDWGGGGLVASHNDLNPRNVLFDGERLWLIDWEAAFRNDACVDPAILANFFARDTGEEQTLIRAWLGRAPDEIEAERLRLGRQLCRLYYAAVLIASGAVGKPAAGAPGAEGPDLASPAGRTAYGRAILNEALAGRRSAACRRAAGPGPA